ncbi:hypothetical protein HNR39_000881 [Glaciimonas immobilis]|uniref:Uncharacterized protein n=1 Tax=Glaciimonas immobilis TaxID=728004 RepID=A0A840RR44_9BURK|nr:hypothetical protein [Glaciimonas immobilis]
MKESADSEGSTLYANIKHDHYKGGGIEKDENKAHSDLNSDLRLQSARYD